MIKVFLFIFVFGLVLLAHASPNLSQCYGSDESLWDHCVGTHVYDGYAVYQGEFTNGLITGYGTYTYVDGDKYIGQHIDGRFSGRGTYFFADGRPRLDGLWTDGKYTGSINKAITYNKPSGTGPEKSSVSRSSQDTSTSKKCLRLGLVPGSDDFRLCMNSRQ